MACPVNDGATLHGCGRDVDGGVDEEQPGFRAVDPGDADSDDAGTDASTDTCTCSNPSTDTGSNASTDTGSTRIPYSGLW
jgi:hypothetical protein